MHAVMSNASDLPAAGLLPIHAMTREEARTIRFVLMDIDDTLTTDGKLTAESYAALWALHDAGLKVIPITGRPAGWCDMIARQWPVDGVVGENGALVFHEGAGRKLKAMYHPEAVPNSDQRLLELKDLVLRTFPQARIARDQFSRCFDIAIDFAEEEPVLPLETAARIKDLCVAQGAHAKISSIHVNVWLGNYDKLSMARRFLELQYGYDDARDRGTVLFAGDSPNDEPMFDYFPMACGVANVLRYRHLMRKLPHFIISKESGAGFAECVHALLDRRRS